MMISTKVKRWERVKVLEEEEGSDRVVIIGLTETMNI